MNDELLKIYSFNQLMINPKYEGELVISRGISYDNSEIVADLREEIGIPNVANNTKIEVLISFINNITDIKFNTSYGAVTLKQILTSNRDKLNTIRYNETFIEKYQEEIYKYIKLCMVKSDKPHIRYGVLYLPSLMRKDVTTALETTMGVNKCRSLLLLLEEHLNGNMIDFQIEKAVKAIKDIDIKYSSIANLLISLGYTYSDYRKYIDRELLLSVSRDLNYYIADEKHLKVVSEKDAYKLLAEGSISTELEKSYVFKELSLNKYIKIGE